ncbi:MAG: trigger factor [Candidatus Krumholzibacteriota bacterium]|nr:trigger factor [Candidatus Krumholzibacteriota bacterium]
MAENLEDLGISVNITEEDDCRKILNIEVRSDLFTGEKERILKNMMKSIVLPGFRKGKAPRDRVKTQFAGEIHNEAMKVVLPMAYEHALYSEKVQPIGEPVFSEIVAEDDKPLTFKVELETAPRIELKQYRGLASKPEEVSVEDKEIENVLKNLQQREVSYNTVDHEARSNDMVTIDYVSIDEQGEPENDRGMKDYPVQLGEGQLFPEFEKAILGKKAGEEGEVAIDYPDDYKPERLAGLKVSFRFTVKEVKEKILPEIDDQFAARIDEKFKTVDDLRNDIREKLLDEKSREARRKVEEEAVDRILEKNPFDVPGSMIERFRSELESEDERRRSMSGMPPEEDEEKKKEMTEFFDRMARRNIKRYFLLGHIANLEKVEISAGDMDKEIERLAEEGGRELEEVRKVIEKGSENYNNLRSRLREKRIFEILLEKE